MAPTDRDEAATPPAARRAARVSADAESLAIERAAYEAWPAAEIEALGGWRLRFDHGVTNRGSSVWPGPGSTAAPLEARLERVERFYAARGAAASYQLSRVSAPPNLDAALAARGYASVSPVSVEVAALASLDTLAPGAGIEAGCEDALFEAWFELSGRRGRFRGEAEAVYRALLGRLAGRAGFAFAKREGELAAVGLAVAAPPWVGVFSMLTREDERRGGLGSAVLDAIARWARTRGAERLYLQVALENAPARALYARAGFRPRYVYHYRRQAR